MRKFEKISSLVVFVLLLYRIFIGSEFNVVLRVGLIILSIFYLWFGFFLFNKINFTDLLKREVRNRLNALKTTAGIVMGVVYSFCILAIVYCIYFYAAMNFVLVTAIIALISSTFLIGLYNTLNMPMQSFYNQFYRRSLIIGVLLFAFWLTPLDAKLDILYKDHPEFIKAYKEYKENPDDPIAKEKLKEARSLFK